MESVGCSDVGGKFFGWLREVRARLDRLQSKTF